MVGTRANAIGPSAHDDVLGRDLQNGCSLSITDGQVGGSGSPQGTNQFFGLFDRRAFLQNTAKTANEGSARRVERRRTVADRAHVEPGDGQSPFIDPGRAAEQSGKANRGKRMLARLPIQRHEAILVNTAERREIEVPSEERAGSRAAFRLDHESGTAPELLHVKEGVDE